MDDDNEHRQHLFSGSEMKLFRFTAVLLAAVVATGLMVLVVWVLAELISVFYSLLLPLSVAGVMALVLYPLVDWLKRKLGMSHRVAVMTLLGLVALALIALVAVVLPSAADQAVAFWESVPDILSRLSTFMSFQFPTLWEMLEKGLDEWEPDFDEVDSEVAERFVSYLGVLLGLATVPFFLFFALLSGRDLREHAKQLLTVFGPDGQREILYLVEVFVGYVTAFFQGQFLIALIMGVLLAAGFTLIGLEMAIAAGLLLGALNIVPYLGTIVGLVVVLPLAFAQPDGGAQLAGLVLLVFALVQWVESWLLTPKIMGEKSGLHPAVVVISIFFWGTALGGVIGMILAVPLTAFFVTLWRHVRQRMAQQFVTHATEFQEDPHREAPKQS